MKLYGLPPTRAIRPLWLLNELGLECEIVALDPLDARSKDTLRELNPSMKVPVLQDDGLILTESVAIMTYLDRRYADGQFAPAGAPDMARVDRWNMFLVTEIEQPLWRMTLHTVIYPEEERSASEVRLAARDCLKELARVEEHLAKHEYLVTEGPTLADFNAAFTLDWAEDEGLLDESSSCRDYLARMYARPAAPPRIAEAMAYLSAGKTPPRYRRDVLPQRLQGAL